MITASVGLTSSDSIHREVYPTLMVFILWESIWNDDSDSYSRGRGILAGIDTGEHNDKHEKALTRKSADIEVLSLGSRMHFAMRTETGTKMENATLISIGDVCPAGASVQRSCRKTCIYLVEVDTILSSLAKERGTRSLGQGVCQQRKKAHTRPGWPSARLPWPSMAKVAKLDQCGRVASSLVNSLRAIHIFYSISLP